MGGAFEIVGVALVVMGGALVVVVGGALVVMGVVLGGVVGGVVTGVVVAVSQVVGKELELATAPLNFPAEFSLVECNYSNISKLINLL